MKTMIAAAALAATTALVTLPAPASALGISVGPRGGVAVRTGGYGYYHHRAFFGPRIYAGRSVYVRPGWHRDWGHVWHPGWHRGWRHW